MSRREQIFKISVLKKLSLQKRGCISVVPSTRLLALPPYFLNDMKSGIIYLLNSILKKYDRALDGILIGYQNIKVLMDENTGIIQMGTAETEVNVSVEFYIFQPKIGSHLQGIVNKKSNNHIGCLVHKYFNATILKPEDVEYEDWICKDLDIDDKVVFKVKDLDFTGLLPYIEGEIDDDELEDILKNKKERDCNLGNNKGMIGDNKSEMCIPEEKCEIGVIGNIDEVQKTKILNKEKLKSELIKKKKKKSEEMENVLKSEKEKNSGAWPKVAAVETEMSDKDELDGKRKRKRKKKGKDDEGSSSFPLLPPVEDLLKKTLWDIPDSKNTGQEEIDNKLNNLMEGEEEKRKKKKKEKKDKKAKGDNWQAEKLEKINECFFEKEDGIFHSTQLGPSLEKLEMTFCSPIPLVQETTPWEKEQKDKRKPVNATPDTPKSETLGKSKKERSSRKRKKVEKNEPNADGPSGSKKLKNLESYSKEIITVRPNRVKNGRLSESGDENLKSAVQSLLEEQMTRVKQEWGTPDGESSSSEQKAVGKKGSKKEKKDSLYEKLMKQAITTINLKREPPKVAAGAQAETSKREPPFSSPVMSKSKRENEKGTGKKRKRKSSEGPEGSPARKKIKNGSMFLLDSSPEKLKEDNSLFSDSENSKASPVKNEKQMNGDASGSEAPKYKVRGMMEDLCRDEEERVKSEKTPGSESGKEKKAKRERRKSGSGEKKKKDSLYEKLLRDAKSLINSSGEETAATHPKKVSKKQKTLGAQLKSLL